MMTNGHSKCYAQVLGNCSPHISSEHYVSAKVLQAISLAENTIRVIGLSFQEPGIEQILGINNLTGNILCCKHNSDLSEYDSTGLKLFNEMERITLSGIPSFLPRLSGNQIEAWMLKTLIGGIYSGNFPVPKNINPKGVLPPLGLLRILFEKNQLIEPLGLYLLHGEEGDRHFTDHNLLKTEAVFGQVAKGANEIPLCGFSMWIFGIEFYLSIMPLPYPLPGRWQHTTYRPTEIVGPTGEMLIIEWDGIGGNRPVKFRKAD